MKISRRHSAFTSLARGSRLSAGRLMGFSLIEILVVTSVITVGFMAILGLIRKAIVVYYNNQNYLAAAAIAQHGLELTRYIRDDNWLTGIPFANDLALSFQNGAKTILAIDQQAMVDSDLVNPGNQGREKIIKFYSSADTNNGGNQLLNLPSGSDAGDLGLYVKDTRAQIYFDRQNHDFYTIRAALMTTNKMPPAGDGAVTLDLFDASRHQPSLFHNLVQTIYYDNGTPGPEDDYLYIISLVYWRDRGADKYFSLATYLDDYSRKY